MNVHIESTYPFWLVLPLVALAVFISWYLYYRGKSDSTLPGFVKWLLGAARFITIMLVGMLIISPWIRTRLQQTVKPVFLVVRDNSRSMSSVADSAGKTNRRNAILEESVKSLNARFTVKEVLFGEKTRPGNLWDYEDGITNPEDLFEYIRSTGRMDNLAGVLIATDGASTRGKGFLEASSHITVPLFFLGVGDTTRFPDVRIEKVMANEWVRGKSLFQVRVYYEADYDFATASTLLIKDRKGVIASKRLGQLTGIQTYADFEIQAPDKGTLFLEAAIVPDVPDKITDNNIRAFQVRVIGQDARVIALFDSPHPDIGALARTFSGIPQIRFEAMPAADLSEVPADCDLLILHNVPSGRNPLPQVLSALRDRSVPVLFIAGTKTDPLALNPLNGILTITGHRKEPEAINGALSTTFTAFTLPDDLTAHLEAWPPLDVPFETYSSNGENETFLTQKIRRIDLNDPLIYFSKFRGGKCCVIAGEGIWRWRMYDFMEFADRMVFDDLFSRLIQYLMQDDSGNRFSVDFQNELFEYSPIRVNARLKNASFELVNEPDVKLTITDSVGHPAEYLMARAANFYELSINGYPQGEYHYSAETQVGTQPFHQEGTLIVLPRMIEQVESVSEFQPLRLMTRQTRGAFFTEVEGEALIEEMKSFRPQELTTRQEYKWYDLINLSWILGLLIFLLTLEWFLRRWYGTR